MVAHVPGAHRQQDHRSPLYVPVCPLLRTLRDIVTTAPALRADGKPKLTPLEYRARRTRLTYEAIKVIGEKVRAGQPAVDVIAAACHVERSTVFHWLQIGRGEHTQRRALPRYLALVAAVEGAEAAWVAEEVGRWTDPAEKPHWKLRQLAIAAKRPEYGDKPSVSVGLGPVATMVAVLAEHYAAKVLEEPKSVEGEWKELGDADSRRGEAEGGGPGAE